MIRSSVKKDVRSVKARSLIANFEKGDVVKDSDAPGAKSPEIGEESARPGTTKNLLAAFEAKGSSPAPVAPIRRTSKVTTSQNRNSNPPGAPQPTSPVSPEPAKAQAKPEPVKEEPKPAEPKPEAVKEEPKPAEPKPEPTKEEPKPAEPKPEPVKEEPKPAEPKPEPVKEEPKPTEPKPEPVKEEPKPAEPKPEPVKEEPKPTEPKPEPVKEEPKPAEPKPVKEEPKPAEPKPEPVKEEPKPAEPKPEPVKEEPKPAEPKPEPVKEEPKPAEPKPEPVKEEPKPAEPTPEPVKEEPKPAEPKPVKEESKPAEPKPMIEEPKPAEPKSEPAKEEPKPAQPKPDPVKEEPKSVKEEAKPAEPKPEPVKEEPKPAEAKPEPVKEEAKPAELKPEPVKEEPKPAEPKPEPVKEEQKPVESKPEPVKEEAKPAVPKPEPVKEEPKPVESKPEPMKEEPKPTEPKPEPVKAEPKPVDTKSEPPKAASTVPVVVKPPAAGSGEKKVLIVFVGQSKSMDAALRDVAIKEMTLQGYDVIVSDLLAQNFNPVLTGDDLGAAASRDDFDYVNDVNKAVANSQLSPEILAEQEKVRSASLIIFQYQNLLHSIPAAVLGWMQKVLLQRFAFDVTNASIYDNGLLKGKKVILSVTSLGPQAAWTDRGILGDINVSLWPIHNGILRFCGLDVINPHVSYGVATAQAGKERQALLDSWQTRLQGIWDERPMNFIRAKDFDQTEGWMLTDRAVSRLLYSPGAPTVGQHLGRPLPSTPPQ